MRRNALGVVAALLLLASCAEGPFYWSRPGATDATFLADHRPCLDAAMTARGRSPERFYKECMAAKGWARGQAAGWRGPESDGDVAVMR